MGKVTTYPLIDNFETTLAQEWDGSIGTIFLNGTPGVTFPSGITTYITVNPGKTRQQVAIIDGFDTDLNTANVTSITVEKGAGVDYTEQTHGVGTIVRITNNYEAWKNVVEAIDGKVDTNIEGTFIGTFADATARDAFITSPVNGKYSAYLTADGFWTDYVGGSWVERATGATPNASETVAGKVEKSTDTQFDNGDSIGETGAFLFATPEQIKTKNDTQDTDISNNATAIASNTGNIGTNTINIATNTSAISGLGMVTNAIAGSRNSTGSQNIAHGLGKTPKIVLIEYDGGGQVGQGKYIDGVSSSIGVVNSGQSRSTTKIVSYTSVNAYEAVVTGLDDTNLTVTWSGGTNVTNYTIYFIA